MSALSGRRAFGQKSQPACARRGLTVGVVAVTAITASIFALWEGVPVVSTGAAYLLAVLLVFAYWSLRARALEGERRRREADLLADLARLLLSNASSREARALLAHRITQAFGLRSAAVRPGVRTGDERRLAIALESGGEQIGTLLLSRAAPPLVIEDCRRLAPSLGSLLDAAAQRERLERELVETEALRRSDAVKTALLRTVSHDLRSPLTAITTAAAGLEATVIDVEDRRELTAVVRGAADRLSRLVGDLLDLSRLEAGAAAPRPDWCSVEELVRGAAHSLAGPPPTLELNFEPDLPMVRVDAAQMERALANLLDNARRHGGEQAVVVNAAVSGDALRIRVSDRGPGISDEALERIFQPFHRDEHGASPGHSGLGLAIARGFVEASGGRVWAMSLPGHGASFVIEIPLGERTGTGLVKLVA